MGVRQQEERLLPGLRRGGTGIPNPGTRVGSIARCVIRDTPRPMISPGIMSVARSPVRELPPHPHIVHTNKLLGGGRFSIIILCSYLYLGSWIINVNLTTEPCLLG